MLKVRTVRTAQKHWLGLLKVMFFFSGGTALLFQVLWTRLLSNIVGSTALAMTCVFAVFVVCLSLGAYLASKLRLYERKAMLTYGALEAFIGVAGLLVTLLLLHHNDIFAAWFGASTGPGRLLLSLLVSLGVTGLPTIAMGATLPVLLSVLQGTVLPRQQVTLLYGINTMGGAFGALCSGFFLIWLLGITGTGSAALGINALIGLGAWYLARAVDFQRLPGTAPDGPVADPVVDRSVDGSDRRVRHLYGLLAFVSGLTALTLEILWGRLSKFYLGDRTMAVASLLFVYLFCLALGSLIVNHLSRRWRIETRRQAYLALAGVFAVGGVAQLLGLQAITSTIEGRFLHFLIPTGREALSRVFVTFLCAFVPVTVLGTAFPLLLRTAERLNRSPGATTGILYSLNTAGSALGCILGGYFIPLQLGTIGGFWLTSGVLVLTAVALLLAFDDGRKRFGPASRRLVLSGVTCACFAVACLGSPRNLHFFDPTREELLEAHEDLYGVQLLTRVKSDGSIKIKNNRVHLAYNLGYLNTSYAQQSISYFSGLLSRDLKSVLNIGTGWGITAGAYTLFDELESLVTVEIFPYVAANQERFGTFNFNYARDPRTRIVVDDGRRYLAASDETYDIISVNVLDPYIPGSSGLFTVDFWRIAKEKLNPGGVYCQLIWGDDVELLMRGMRTQFPTILYFLVYGDFYNVVAFPEEADQTRLKMDRVNDRIRSALRDLGLDNPEEFLQQKFNEARFQRVLFADRLDRASPGPLHSEDRPILEYRWSHGRDTVSVFDSLTVEEE